MISALDPLRKKIPLSDQQIADLEETKQGTSTPPVALSGNTVRGVIPKTDQQIADMEETSQGGPSLVGNSITKPIPKNEPNFFGPPGALLAGERNTQQSKASFAAPIPTPPEKPVDRVQAGDQSYPIYKRGGAMS